ncbi:putative membrane protein [Mycolicibacterium fluoranthenivorans]|uniref:Putative membrane protein n=2 Tax=Mycolicibacterium fluoranthenivorans TaxID=258505 RepID=A0A7X5U5G5_9MYCO|nr:putative membrane protein [Mycolicibacterium fluoranthenivorans]
MMYDGWGWGGMGSGGWILMTVLMVLFWAAVITAVVLAIRYLTGPRHTSAHPPGSGPARAEGLLAERFARGEIDEDEFQRRMTLLREHR